MPAEGGRCQPFARETPARRPAAFPTICPIAGRGAAAHSAAMSQSPIPQDHLAGLSAALADHVGAVSGCLVALHTGGARHASGILWQPDAVVASEQMLPDAEGFKLTLPGGASATGTLAGRDPSTNVAVLRLDPPVAATLPPPAEAPRPGALALVLGAGRTGGPTARLAMVHEVGPPWQSLAGGRIDALLRLNARLGADEGGPVLDAAGRLLGMSTTGPRRRALVIPAATIARVIGPLLAEGRVARGWLGVALQPVAVPDALREAAGCAAGMMVQSLAVGGPAEAAGVLPGDILLALDDATLARPRGLGRALGAERIGQSSTIRLLRGGTVQSIAVTIAARPAATARPAP